MAKAFDENTMNGSLDTAKTAGTESRAKITSVNSTTTRVANSGVAARLALTLVKKWSPSMVSVTGMIRLRSPRPTVEVFSPSSSRCRIMRMPVKIRNSPNTTNSQKNRLIKALPTRMNTRRSTRAPKTPQNNTRCWYLSGMAMVEKRIDHTKTLSTLRDFSIR